MNFYLTDGRDWTDLHPRPDRESFEGRRRGRREKDKEKQKKWPEKRKPFFKFIDM